MWQRLDFNHPRRGGEAVLAGVVLVIAIARQTGELKSSAMKVRPAAHHRRPRHDADTGIVRLLSKCDSKLAALIPATRIRADHLQRLTTPPSIQHGHFWVCVLAHNHLCVQLHGSAIAQQ